jgi:dihydropyrimidinase
MLQLKCVFHIFLLARIAEAAVPELLIRGGTVVNADGQFEADVLIGNGKITAVGRNIRAKRGVKVVDASGKLVMPGGIDPHTHLAMPFMGQTACDDFYRCPTFHFY